MMFRTDRSKSANSSRDSSSRLLMGWRSTGKCTDTSAQRALGGASTACRQRHPKRTGKYQATAMNLTLDGTSAIQAVAPTMPLITL